MSRIWSMMDVGKRSLMNSQTGLQTVAHNIANRTTDGYSRQTVQFKTNEPVGFGKNRIGMGARPGEISRTNNTYVEKQLEKEGNQMGFLEGRADMLGRVEQVYNEQANKGLNQYMSDLFNAFREMSNNPESLASRTLVKESADFLAKDFKRVSTQLDEIQSDIDYRVTTKIEEVNQTTKEIAQLNEKIQVVEMAGGRANDERDRRDLLLKKLGEAINIRYAEGKDGSISVTAGNTALLVSGFSQRNLEVMATPMGANKREGRVEIFYKSTDTSTPVNVTKQLVGGHVGGLLDVRDNVINGLHDRMDELAYSFATQVNEAHFEGYNRYGRSGVILFELPTGLDGAAANIQVNRDIKEDVGQIAAAGAPNSPGDNRIANVLSALQYKQVMEENTATLDAYYGSVVGQIGVEAQRANSAQTSQKDIYAQLRNIRESISGVSLDEETTKMIEYQKSFDASARLIRTADEMMDTVLNLKRM
ncbi:MAG: flagellar hook-associated protein FlgK [Bdellovibrionales bacterium]